MNGKLSRILQDLHENTTAGYTNEEGVTSQKYAMAFSEDDKEVKVLQNIFKLVDSDSTKIELGEIEGIKHFMRPISAFEETYAHELADKYFVDVGLNKIENDAIRKMVKDFSISAIRLCISGTKKRISRSADNTLAEISSNSCIPLSKLNQLTIGDLNFLAKTLDSITLEANPEISDIPEDELGEIIDLIKKNNLALSDLDYISCIQMLNHCLKVIETMES